MSLLDSLLDSLSGSGAGSPSPPPPVRRPTRVLGPVLAPVSALLAWVRRGVRGHHRRVDVAATVMVVVAVAAYALSDRLEVVLAAHFGVIVFNALSAVGAALSTPREERLVPGLIAGGITLAVLGDVLCAVYDSGGVMTDTSPADPAWLASYVVLCLAMLLVLVRAGGDRRGVGCLVLDLATVVSVSVIICWSLAIGRLATDEAVSTTTRVVWSSYPALQGVLLALVLMVMMRQRTRGQVGVGFAVGVALWLVTNILYVHAPSPDALLAAGAAWMGAVTLMARTAWLWRPSVDEPVAEGGRRGWVAPLVIGVAPLLVPAGVEVVSDSLGGHHHPILLAVGSTVLALLAFVRTARLMLGAQRLRRDLERARDRALAASRAKSMFVATMSHELRTPLTTVVACAEMLDGTDLDGFQRGLVRRLRRAGGSLQDLVEDILDYSRLEAGHLELAEVPFDLHEVVARLCDVHRPAAVAAGLEFQCALAPDVPRSVVGDPGRLLQVGGSLLDNAVKFTDHGRVRLEVRLAPDAPPDTASDTAPATAPDTGRDLALQVVVTDTGIGIAPERQEAVFAAFEQVDGSSTRRHGGTGLGLAICRRLVQLMGGRLELHSDLGRGSQVVATVLLTRGEQSPTSDGPAPPGPRRTLDPVLTGW